MLRYENKDVREIHSGAHRIENNANTELGAYTAESSKETEAWSEKEIEHNVSHTSQHELSDRIKHLHFIQNRPYLLGSHY